MSELKTCIFALAWYADWCWDEQGTRADMGLRPMEEASGLRWRRLMSIQTDPSNESLLSLPSIVSCQADKTCATPTPRWSWGHCLRVMTCGDRT